MPERICAGCGNKKSIRNGKICEKGHFLCYSCSSGKSRCPMCDTNMR